MSSKPTFTATCLSTVLCAFCLSAAPGAVQAWPATQLPQAQTAPPNTPADQAKAQAARRATPEQRAAADRLDPLSRSAFWSREVEIDPTDPVAGVELGSALRAMGHYDEAAAAVSRVLVLKPNDLPALLESASISIAANKGFYAIEPLKRAQTLAPKDWRPHSLMGIAREQNEQSGDAEAEYLKALALSPKNPAVLSNLALWYVKHGDPAQAETLLRQAVAEPSASAQERQNLAFVLGMEGRYDQAERLMREDLPPPVVNNNLAYLKAMGPQLVK
jgi:Flp pilus assembly protein TadD